MRSEKKMKWERNKICFKERTLNIDMRKWHQRSLCFSLGVDLHIRRFYSQVTLERLVALLRCNSHFDRRIWQRLHTITVSAIGWSWKVWWICHILSNSSSLLFKIWVRWFGKFSLHNLHWSLFDMMVDVWFEKLKNKDKFEIGEKKEKLLVRRLSGFLKNVDKWHNIVNFCEGMLSKVLWVVSEKFEFVRAWQKTNKFIVENSMRTIGNQHRESSIFFLIHKEQGFVLV